MNLLSEAGTDEESLIKELNNKRLVYKGEEDNLLLLTDKYIV